MSSVCQGGPAPRKMSSRRGTALSIILGVCALLAVLGKQAGAEDSPRPGFVERADAAGIDFTQNGNPTPEKYLIETMGGGVAVLDFDNDGFLDLFFVNSGSFRTDPERGFVVDRSRSSDHDRLYLNNRDGTFSDVTAGAGVSAAGSAAYGMGAAAGDYDNDGWVDLYVTQFGGSILYRNRSDGSFEDVTSEAGVRGSGWPVSAGFLDYDRDGDLDLFVARYLDWNYNKHERCGGAVRTYCPPLKLDPIDNLLFRNEGDGSFSDVSQEAGIAGVMGKSLGVAFNDYNGDGWPDIAVANDSVGQLLFENRRDGTFSEVALDTGFAYTEDGGVYSGMGIGFADYDNDGAADIVITNLAKERYAIYRNDRGTFRYVTRQSQLGRITAFMSGWGALFVDLDHDGWKDFFAAQSHVLDNVDRLDTNLRYRQPPLIARNVQGKFENVSAAAGAAFEKPVAGRGAAFGDLDNDGDIDVVVGVLNDRPLLLYSNASETANHWLILELEGVQSNRGGLGASVKITRASGSEQWGYATRAGSYLSANDPRVHFGLGGDDIVSKIEITWPSGREQVLTDVEADQILRVTEPPPSAAAR